MAEIYIGYNLQCLKMHSSLDYISLILLSACVVRELGSSMFLNIQRKGYFFMLNFHQFVNCHFYRSIIFLVWRIQDCDDA